MKPHLLAAFAMLFAAVTFGFIGYRAVPRNNTYVILGVVFALLAAVRFRRARKP